MLQLGNERKTLNGKRINLWVLKNVPQTLNGTQLYLKGPGNE